MKRWHGPAMIYATIGVMLMLSWQRWCDPLIDFGREVYVPWQLSLGKELYQDIAYFNGPISPYFNALIFRVFGEGILTLAMVNAILLGITLTILHAILSKIGDLAMATLACVCIVPLLCIAQAGAIANYNFITPYSHEMTHGLLLSFAAIACLMRVRRGWDILAGLCAGLTILTKPEIAIACIVSVIVGASVACRAIAVLRIMIAILVPPAVAFVLFRSDGFIAYQHLADSRITSLLFYKLTMGTADLQRSFTNLVLASAVWSALAALLFIIGRTFKTGKSLPFAVVSFLIAIGLAVLFQTRWSAAATPLIVATPLMARFVIRKGDTQIARGVAKITFLIFATLLLGKIALNVTLSNYGFALALPAMAGLIVMLGSIIPNSLGSRGINITPMRGAVIGFFVGLSLTHLTYSLSHWGSLDHKTAYVSEGKDRIVYEGGSGRDIVSMLESLQSLPGNATIAVFPQGAMLNYLTRRENPTPYIVLMPPEVLMFSQETIVKAYEAHPPEYVLFVQTNLDEYGYRSFDEYTPGITGFLKANYEPIQQGNGWFLLEHR